ncbi:MAG: hypothetical protein H0U49_07500 [Parachlamydiaceae bacterium]|nr:hypothetical protein [Parachlamydiaceae bacterium]
MTGLGKLTSTYGYISEGVFLMGKLHGRGILYGPDHKIIYEGDFHQSIREGQGKLFPAEGGVCEGQFVQGFIVNGTKKYPIGDVYKGEFKNNLPHGEGECTSVDGRTFKGIFENGVPKEQ